MTAVISALCPYFGIRFRHLSLLNLIISLFLIIK